MTTILTYILVQWYGSLWDAATERTHTGTSIQFATPLTTEINSSFNESIDTGLDDGAQEVVQHERKVDEVV